MPALCTWSVKLRNALRLTRDIVYLSDTTHIRWLMAFGSIIWGLNILFEESSFHRPIHQLMVWIVEWPVSCLAQWLPFMRLDVWANPREVWGIAFVAYGACAWWRIYSGRPRRYLGLAVNTLGFVLWFTSTLAMSLALGRFSLAMVLEWILSAQLLLIAIRTGLNNDMSSP